MAVQRSTVDLSRFPDLVVIYLGMQVRSLRGMKTVFSFGPRISAAVAAKPDGLLLHESIFYSVFPCTWACASIGVTSPHSKPGLAPCPIRSGGALLKGCWRRRVLARNLLHARGDGSRLRNSTMRWASPPLHRTSPLREPCSVPASGWVSRENPQSAPVPEDRLLSVLFVAQGLDRDPGLRRASQGTSR